MDQTRSLDGGSGRYHSRAVMPPPRPPPRPPPVPASPGAGPSGPPAPPAPPAPAPGTPPSDRFMVLAPPLPNVSYIRSMPLWFDDMKPRYPGDQASTNA